MTRPCRTAVRLATGDVFSDAEIDDFLDRLAARAKRKRQAAPTADEREAIRSAAEELTREDLHGLLVDRRLKVAAELARTGRRAQIDAMPRSMSEADRLAAFDVGSEKQGLGTSLSVDAEQRAESADAMARVKIALDKAPGLMNRIGNFWGVGERSFDRLVAREMARLQGAEGVEPTGDEGALHAARAFVMGLEHVRQLQNDAGAWIEHLPGYIVRQNHDRLRLAGGFWRELGEAQRRIKAGELKGAGDLSSLRAQAEARAFGEWRDFIKPKLDPRTFEGLGDEDVAETPAGAVGLAKDASPEDRFLFNVWFNVVTGKREATTGADDFGDFRPPASKARSVSQSRVLHFQDADAWMDYNERYGRGSVFSAVASQIERGAKNAVLMRRWGPAPEASRVAEVDRLINEARARGPGGAASAQKLAGSRLKANFDAVTGSLNAPENLRLATVTRSIRTFEGLTKLGSMLLSKVVDLPMAGHTFARAGAGFLSGYDATLRGLTRLTDEEGKHAAELLGVGVRSFSGHLMGRFTGSDGPLGWGSWASRLHYRINGFDLAVEGQRVGAAQMFMRHLGVESQKGWDGLRPGTRETLERFGIDAAEWEKARAGAASAQDGARYFSLDHLDDEPRLALKFKAMIHNVIDDAVMEPRAREQVKTTLGTQAGTGWGEAVRALTQFHGVLATILGRHLVPAATGYAGYSPIALLAHFIIGSTLAGYISMNLKLIAAGKAPRWILGDPDDPHGQTGDMMKIWAASLVQGGGLGIYGDFLFGEENRQGGGLDPTSFAGPAVGDVAQAAGVVRDIIRGERSEKTGAFVAPGEAVRFGTTHIPLVNTFYSRWALDYLVLWGLQERVSPGFLQRYERNVEQRQGTHFLISPSAAVGG